MQELRLVTDGSDPSSLLLRPADTDGTDGADGDTTPAAEFWLPVTDELRDLLGVRPAAGTATAGTADGAASATDPAGTATPVAQPAADAVPAGGTGKDARHFASGRRHVDQQRSPRLRLSPKDIQGRIRHGESVADIVGDTGMDPSRVEPYAHPILLERERIATLAHDAHPVRSDGPAEHTLWEVLATALAARGDSVRDAEWDAHQDFSGQWVVTVAWGRGGSALEAEFTYEPQRQGPSTAVPRNSVATDIIDPRFERPVRSVAAVTPLSGDRPAPLHGDDAEFDYPPRREGTAHPAGRAHLTDASDPDTDADADAGADDPDGLLRHPDGDADEGAHRRRRKAVTPHWEDVLLGVRTTPKKKR
ncbi:septation protein SepH [Corynebacterium bovis]|uniref:septation protein SepH n=1 Tax=Corynebacterium bovis TaxID=36808 RepID=UPI00254F55C7|nr:septation protein SepH [Corynebacterium bovis]MDK8511355.1 septation protein SepH [Corynebacterium bovis]